MKITSVLFVLISSFQLSAQLSTEYIDSVVQTSMKAMPHAGVAVAVVKDGKVIHSKGYGIASLSSGKKVDENTRFSIASNSKAFTTTALGMLVDQGKLAWTDKVIDILPEFRMYDPYVTEHFMVVDLVTHRSGLGLGAGDLMFIPDGSDFTVEDVIPSFQYQKSTSEFRTKYDYDNLLYIVAGEVIHKISGKPWDTFIEEEIMTPLGIKESAGYRENLSSKKNVAMPHSSEAGKLVEINEYNDPNKLFGAAGGIYASVNDLSKWMLFHLNGGNLDDDTLLTKETHAKMWNAETMLHFNAEGSGPYNNHFEAYGLGWSMEDQNGYTIVSHTGGMPGMLSQTVLIPELNAGIVVLTNAAPGGYSFISVANEIKDELIGLETDIDWVNRMLKYIEYSESQADDFVSEVWATCEKAKSIDLDLDLFAGTYKDDWFGEVSIENRDGELWFVSKRSPRLTGKMSYYQANTFAIAWEYKEMNCDAFASFTLDENGKGIAIKMKGISPNIDFSFDFHDLDLLRVEE